jgi:hypothetical protein
MPLSRPAPGSGSLDSAIAFSAPFAFPSALAFPPALAIATAFAFTPALALASTVPAHARTLWTTLAARRRRPFPPALLHALHHFFHLRALIGRKRGPKQQQLLHA